MASQIYWEKNEKEEQHPLKDAQEQIFQLWYQLNPQDGAISVPSVLHLSQKKTQKHTSADPLKKTANSLHGLYNQEAIIPFFPSLVSYQVP